MQALYLYVSRNSCGSHYASAAGLFLFPSLYRLHVQLCLTKYFSSYRASVIWFHFDFVYTGVSSSENIANGVVEIAQTNVDGLEGFISMHFFSVC